MAFLCYILFSVTGKLYFDNDNLMIGVVTNGIYGEDYFCQYLHPLLCLIIRGLAVLMPTADCFLVVTSVFTFIEVMALTYIAMFETGGKPFKHWDILDWILRALLVCGICFLSLSINIWSINYTAQTTSLVFAGIISLFVCKHHKEQRTLGIIGTALIIMGFMMRIEGALIIIPFVILLIASDMISGSTYKTVRENVKSYVQLMVPCVVVITGLLISRSIFWSAEPHASAWEYNKVRTITGDFRMHHWSKIKDVIEDTDQTEYESPVVWSLIDTDVLNTEKLAYLADIGSTSKYPFTIKGIFKTLAEMKQKGFTLNLGLLLLLIVTIVFAVRNIFCLRNKWFRLESFFSVFGSFLILFYFTFKGRAPLHVWQSVIFACAAVLIIAAIYDAEIKKDDCNVQYFDQISRKDGFFMLLMSGVLYFSIGQMIANSSWHAPTTAFTARTGADESEYDQTIEGNNLFIWPSFWESLAGKYVEKGKLPSREVLEHNIPLGYWSYGQVYFTDVLRRINAENPAKALLERPDTYLVQVNGMDEFVLEYMQAHYGKSLKLEKAGEINGYTYFKLIKDNSND